MPRDWISPANDTIDYAQHNWLIYESYNTPMAQGQRLRESQGVLPEFYSSAIRSPDAQSQQEIGYTQPIQDFTGGPTISGQYFKQPGGITSGTPASQPSLKQASPRTPIPTGMPWNY